MAVCYFLGAKQIHSKKSGKDFYTVTLLTRNNWGDWETYTKFCEETVFTQITQDIEPGFPVICSLDMGGNLIQCIAHDSVPPLELYTDN